MRRLLSVQFSACLSIVMFLGGCNAVDPYLSYRLSHPRQPYYQENMLPLSKVGPDGLKTFRSEVYQIEYKYPKTWENFSTVPDFKKGVFGNLHISGSKNFKTAQINVETEQSVTSSMTLKECHDQWLAFAKKHQLEILEEGPVTVSGQEAYYSIFRGLSKVKGIFNKGKQVELRRNGTLYTISFWTNESDYHKLIADGETVFNSFKFLK